MRQERDRQTDRDRLPLRGGVADNPFTLSSQNGVFAFSSQGCVIGLVFLLGGARLLLEQWRCLANPSKSTFVVDNAFEMLRLNESISSETSASITASLPAMATRLAAAKG